MQSDSWAELLRKLPPDVHHQLVLNTIAGTEFAVQAILLVEGQCLIFKGRLSGCQDAGRLFYVPFDHIDYMGFNRVISEDEFKAWHGVAEPPLVAPTAPEANGTAARSPIANRAALLEKIRARNSPSGP